MDVERLLRQSEGKSLEFKRDFSNKQNLLKTLVAFANTAGGVVLIGLEDKNHTIKGVESPLDLEEAISSSIYDNITPKLVPEIEVLSWRDRTLLGIEVFPSPNRPHYLTKQGLHNGTYIRVGSSNRVADNTIIDELRRQVKHQSYDELAMTELSSEAIDFRAASEQFSSVKSLSRKDLETLGLVTRYQNRKVPTIAGVLLFSPERENHFPDAWIQAGRFEGTDKSNILDHQDLHSYLIESPDQAMRFVEKHAFQAIAIETLRHRKAWSIPWLAVREALINAIVHADYSQRGAPIRVAMFDDRIEIENPGLLPFGLTTDEIKHGVSKLRNRVMGRVFYKLGLIEHWGSGVRRIIKTCTEGGFDMPIFEEVGWHFRVTIRLTKPYKPVYDQKDQQIIELLAQEQGKTNAEIAEVLGISTRATRQRLASLLTKGVVVAIASSTQDPQRRYYLANQ
jgi:predicted HTH transcriptional regulator